MEHFYIHNYITSVWNKWLNSMPFLTFAFIPLFIQVTVRKNRLPMTSWMAMRRVWRIDPVWHHTIYRTWKGTCVGRSGHDLYRSYPTHGNCNCLGQTNPKLAGRHLLQTGNQLIRHRITLIRVVPANVRLQCEQPYNAQMNWGWYMAVVRFLAPVGLFRSVRINFPSYIYCFPNNFRRIQGIISRRGSCLDYDTLLHHDDLLS